MTFAAAARGISESAHSATTPETTLMTTEEWMRLRSSVMHDWLSAKVYLGRLSAIQLVLSGQVERPGFNVEKVREAVLEWRSRRGDVERLVRSFEVTMSPGHYVERSPLIGMPGEIRDALAQLADGLWRRRLRPEHLSNSSLAFLLECDRRAERLVQSVNERGVHVRQARLAVRFTAFYEAVRDLQEALSRLPSRITVT